jgi:selenocysteine lyase/cysteine desulfurase
VQARTHYLNRYLKEQLADIKGVELATTRDAGAIVRTAPGLLNSTDEIDTALEFVGKIS